MLKLNGSVVNSLHVWPNPYISQLNVDFKSGRDCTVQIRISSTDGKTIIHLKTAVKKGQNDFVIRRAQNPTKGTCILNLVSENKMETIKIIKQ